MQMYKIYLAGGMSDMSPEDENGVSGYRTWRREVKDQLKSGIYDSIYNLVVVDPSEYFNFEEQTYETEREIMEFDLHKVRTSDLIIVNFNAHRSLGTMAELAISHDRRIPIIGLWEDEDETASLHPWQYEFCQRIFDDRGEMIDYVVKYYLN